MVNLAWEVSNGDKEFIYLIEAEGDEWRIDQPSRVFLRYDRVNKKNIVCNKDNWTNECKMESSFGFCQTNKYYHSKTVNDPRFFTDARWQLEQCYKKFKEGTPFYGYQKHRYAVIERFSF